MDKLDGTLMADVKDKILHSPGLRNAVHAAVFVVFGLPLIFVVRLGWLPHTSASYWIAGFLGVLTLFNLLILPRTGLGKKLRRDKDATINGLWLYPFSMSLAFLIFPLFAAFAAWAVLSWGDAAASFAGRAVPVYRLHWNDRKSYAGIVGFFACAFCGAYLSLWLMPCPLFLKADGSPELPFVWTLALLVAAAGAVVESLSSRVDDNLTVPAATGGMAVAAAYFLNVSTRSLPAGTHVQPEEFVHALIANAVLGTLILLAGFASVSAVAIGMILGTLVYFYAHWQGFLMLTLFVGLGSLLSRVGIEKKRRELTAEANSGKRGIGNVVANLLVPALCCAAYPLTGGRPSLLMAFAGALAAALADTASSEIGVLSSVSPRLITTFKNVPRGTNGAVSILGTSAAVAGAGLMAIVGCVSGFVQLAAGAPLSSFQIACAGFAILFAGLAGTIVDSLLGATVEGKIRGVGKGAVNFLCTLTGAGIGLVLTEGGMFILRFWK